MTKSERIAEFRGLAQGSLELARDTVQNTLKWMEYLRERELSTGDHAALLEALERLYLVAQPINEKYIDGQEA